MARLGMGCLLRWNQQVAVVDGPRGLGFEVGEERVGGRGDRIPCWVRGYVSITLIRPLSLASSQ